MQMPLIGHSEAPGPRRNVLILKCNLKICWYLLDTRYLPRTQQVKRRILQI